MRLNARRRHDKVEIILVNGPLRYPPAPWNRHDSVLNDTACRNNFPQRRHNKFHIMVGKEDPSLYDFFKELREKQAGTEAMFRQLQLGQLVKKCISKKRHERKEHISIVVRQYKSMSIMIIMYRLFANTWTLCQMLSNGFFVIIWKLVYWSKWHIGKNGFGKNALAKVTSRRQLNIPTRKKTLFSGSGHRAFWAAEHESEFRFTYFLRQNFFL